MSDTRSAQVQAALYRIAETASAAQDMQEFYAEIHRIVGELMYANNFYVVLYDEERRMMNWPFATRQVMLPARTSGSRWGLQARAHSVPLRKVPMMLTQADIDDHRARGDLRCLVGRLAGVRSTEGRTVARWWCLPRGPPRGPGRGPVTFVASHVGAALSGARRSGKHVKGAPNSRS